MTVLSSKRRRRPAHRLLTLPVTLFATLTAAVFLAAACSRPCDDCGPVGDDRVMPIGAAIPAGGGRRFTGKPYLQSGKWFYPRAEPDYDVIGTAAWMAPKFHGRRTANGEVHDMTALVAAHPTLPLPSYVMVQNIENNRKLVVRVNDRGPFNHGRILDLSHRAAEFLGFVSDGLAKVRVQYIREAPLSGDTSYEDYFLVRQPWARCDRDRNGQVVACRPPPEARPVARAMAQPPRRWSGF